jgi:ketosteroid isomerase-like protein
MDAEIDYLSIFKPLDNLHLMKRILYLILPAFIFMACQNSKNNCENDIKEVMNTDISFSDFSVKEGMKKAFIAYADEKAVLLRNNTMPIEGLDKIKTVLDKQLDTTYVLTWKPIFCDVSNSGDFAYTYGTYDFKPKSDTMIYQGTYCTIWKKQTDKTWKWVLDVGNDGLK